MQYLVNSGYFEWTVVLCMATFVIVLARLNKRAETAGKAAELASQCAKCGCNLRPGSKRIKVSGGEYTGFYARVCIRCYRRNFVIETVAWALIGGMFIFAYWVETR